ncbi:MAG: HD-GYP domain-containing protein [Burkholderiaceae bacterium]
MTTLEELDYPDTISRDNGLYRVAAVRVMKGMHVAELDRPWSDTPLVQHALVVRSNEELDAIRQYCQFVVVDAQRSDPQLLGAIRAAAMLSNYSDADALDEPLADAGEPSFGESAFGELTGAKRGVLLPGALARRLAGRGEPKARNDVRPSDQARQQVRSLIAADRRAASGQGGHALERLRGWLARDKPAGEHDSPSHRLAQLKQLREQLNDPRIGTAVTTDSARIREVLPRLRPLHARLVAATQAVVHQARLGNTPSLAELIAAVDPFVAGLRQWPDATRWIGAVYLQTAPVPLGAAAVALQLADFGRAMGLPDEALRELTLIGLLADIGKALLPREVIEHPGVLAPQDYALMQQHVSIGQDILRRAGGLSDEALRGIAEHHERLDGSGYPNRLAGSAIGLYGQMAAIVDTFTALTMARPYANPMPVEEALSALHDWAGKLFDRSLVELFIVSVGAYPIGSLVELSSGEVAAVAGRNPAQRQHPKLVVLTGVDKGPLRAPPAAAAAAARRRPRGSGYGGASVRIARGLPPGAFGLRLKDFYARAELADDDLSV